MTDKTKKMLMEAWALVVERWRLAAVEDGTVSPCFRVNGDWITDGRILLRLGEDDAVVAHSETRSKVAAKKVATDYGAVPVDGVPLQIGWADIEPAPAAALLYVVISVSLIGTAKAATVAKDGPRPFEIYLDRLYWWPLRDLDMWCVGELCPVYVTDSEREVVAVIMPRLYA